MANTNFNIGTGEGESPVVPSSGAGPNPNPNPGSASNFGVRTMASDLNAVKSGETPKPYTPTGAPTPPPPPPGLATKTPGSSPTSFDLPPVDFGGPTTPTIGAPGSGTSSPSPLPEPKKKGGKGIFTLIITLIIVVGLAALGYFVIYPMFFATPTIQPSAPAAATQPPVETPPTSTVNTPVPATTTATTSTTSTISAPLPHVSLFKTPADAALTASTVTTGANLGNLNINTSTAPQLVEVAYADQSGNPIGFANIMQTVFGLYLNSPALQGVWNDQGTAGTVYVDASGTEWLGFVTAVNSSSSLAAVKSAFDQALEANTDWTGAYAANPGTAATAWKTGSYNGTATRYLDFSSGDSMNYAWVGHTLVIGSSYAGFKDALSKL